MNIVHSILSVKLDIDDKLLFLEDDGSRSYIGHAWIRIGERIIEIVIVSFAGCSPYRKNENNS